MAVIKGDIDTTYLTQQRDMFASGLVAQVGANALTVWLAIKSHADFATGEAWCGVRRVAELTGLSAMTVQRAIKTLMDAHLLRVARREGQRVIYVARERMDLRIGSRVIVTVAIDYVPNSMRKRLEKLKAAAADVTAENVFADVDVYPGPGFTWDAARAVLSGQLRADEVPVRDELDILPTPQNVASVLTDSTDES